LERAVRPLTGLIQQRPPAFSALKVAGRRAYDLARAGQQVELAERPVTIHQLTIVGYDYPSITLHVVCSSGTYVRSLGRDLAISVGTAAVMSALVRTAIGPFVLSEAIDPAQLSKESLPNLLRSPLEALAELPCLRLGPAEARQIANGIAIQAAATGLPVGYQGECSAVDTTGRLTAIIQTRPGGLLAPVRNFPVA
jgi:tRNA pseudouridine55 synthase